MRTRRFVSKDNLPSCREILIEGDEARHLLKVLRLGPGDKIEVIDGQGNLVEAKIDRVYPRRSQVISIPASSVRFEDDRLPIVLLVSPIKSEKMADLVRNVTQCGVHTILPVITERTAVRLEKDRIERLKKIALQSLKQSGGLHSPDILAPISLEKTKDTLGKIDLLDATKIVLCPEKTSTPLVKLALKTRPPWVLMVGPEGGLTGQEIEFLKGAGFMEANLGPRVLRTETACTVAVGLLGMV